MERKYFFCLLLLALLVSPVIVSAAESMTIYEYLKENGIPFIDLTDYITEDYRTIYMNFLVGLIYFLVMFNVMEFLPFFNSTWSKFFASLAVSILGLIFLGQRFFDIVISEYEALGIIFAIFVPLVVIIVFIFNIEIKKRNGKINIMFANLIVGAIFFILGLYFFYKTLTAEGFGWYIFGIVILVLLFLTKNFFFGKIAHSIIKQARNTGVERLKEGAKDINAVADSARETIDKS